MLADGTIPLSQPGNGDLLNEERARRQAATA
jgi:hypothetical protein